ncbi:MAG: dockerin type I domain-containing protein [Planctomycetota bacterium]
MKSIACVAAAAALSASLASAQSISVELQRDGMGTAVLDSNGDWVWEVTLTNGSLVSAANVVFGADFSDSPVLGGSVTATGVGNGDVESATVGTKVFGWEADALAGAAFAEGLQVDPAQGATGQAFYAYGTDVLAAGESLLLGTFTTEGPAIAMDRSPTSSISIVSGSVSQIDGTTPAIVTGLTDSDSATAAAGDVNLDGAINISDVSVIFPVFNTAVTNGWAGGDLNGDGTVNISDVSIIFPVFNTGTAGTGPITAGVPEPASMALVASLAAVTPLIRRRR